MSYQYTCATCGKDFIYKYKKKYAGTYCSKDCRYKAMKGNQHAKGHTHTPEALQKISDASKALWQARFANPSTYGALPMHPGKMPYDRRSRITEWKTTQIRDWKDDQCAFCGSTENLQLDHIVARFLGGDATRENCQTLCKSCNYWKHWHIDWPQYKALQAKQAAKH